MTKRKAFRLPTYANQDRLVLMRGTGELEHAKTIMRKTGRVVFNAEIVNPGQRGLVMVDGIACSREQVIDMAREIEKRLSGRSNHG